MFNPTMLFQIKNMWDRFQSNHPKFPRFLQVVGNEYMQEGTVLEISVTKANGENLTSNIKLNKDDMDLIAAIKNMSGQM